MGADVGPDRVGNGPDGASSCPDTIQWPSGNPVSEPAAYRSRQYTPKMLSSRLRLDVLLINEDAMIPPSGAQVDSQMRCEWQL
jgi:hypothetical protein